ncbi:hypothetical protein ACTA71_011901 [Dictyostelium dimigraforme]
MTTISKTNQIISVELMVKNGNIDLLKNKVNNGDYLFFKETEIKNKYPIVQYEYSIFNQREEFDYGFYKNLFKNYSNYFLFSKNLTAENKILPYDNVMALKVLINEFNYQPTPNYLIQSIRNSKFKISSYLNENHKSITTDLVKFFSDDGRACKMISADLNSISIVPTLINHRNLFRITLSTLYTTCSLIIGFSKQLDTFIKFMNDLSNGTTPTNSTIGNNELNFDVPSLLKYFKYLTSPEKPFNLLSKRQLNEMKFTDDELKQLVGSFSSNDERVENLIRMILPFSGRYGYSENFTSYQYKYSNITLKSEHVNLEIDPLEFGVLDFNLYKNRNILKENQQVFKFINSDKDKQISFINSIIETFNKEINNQSNNSTTSSSNSVDELSKQSNETKLRKKLSPEIFFKLLVRYDNVEYLEMIHKGLFSNGKNQIPFDFIDYVKSNEMFNYILQFIDINYIKKTTSLHNIIKRLIKTGRIELLNNFKSNYREFYNECFKHLTFKTNDDETYFCQFLENQFGFPENLNQMNYYHHSTTLNGFKYLYSNYTEFQSCFFNNYKEWEITNLSGIDDLKYLINETPLVKIDIKWNQIKGEPPIDENVLLEFVINHNSMVNESNNPELKKFIVTKQQTDQFSNFKKSIQEALPITEPIESLPLSFIFDRVSNDLNQLEYLMSNYFKDNNQNVQKQYYLSYLFTNVIFFGRLHVFKYLKQNYRWVFDISEIESNDSTSPSTSSKNGLSLFSPHLPLFQMYKDIIHTGNIDMFLFFTHELLLPFADKEIKFDENPNNLSLLKFIKKNQIMF